MEDRRKLELEAAIKDTSPDSPEETKFRPIVRVRLTGMQGEVPQQEVQELLTFGQQKLGLTELKSYRVVMQEAERKKHLAQDLKFYEDTFKSVIADGKVTAAERVQLKDLQKTLRLEDSEVQGVESKYTFKEAQEAKAPAPPKPAPSKPKVVPKKETAPAKPPAGIGPAKTAPAKPGIGGSTAKPNN
jgi:hypothetical protein